MCSPSPPPSSARLGRSPLDFSHAFFSLLARCERLPLPALAAPRGFVVAYKEAEYRIVSVDIEPTEGFFYSHGRPRRAGMDGRVVIVVSTPSPTQEGRCNLAVIILPQLASPRL